MAEENPAAERLYKQRLAVAEEFKLDFDDWRVRQLALLQARHAAAEDQTINGVLIDIGDLLALNQAIADMRQTLNAAEPCNISVHFVKGLTGICPKCKAHIPDYKPPTPPAPPPTPPVPAPVTEVFARPLPEESASTAVKPDKASPQVTHRVGVSASAFHSQISTPLKRLQPYRTADQLQRDPHPYRDAAGGDRSVAHPLPVPHGVIW
jgi:hypothetical protein